MKSVPTHTHPPGRRRWGRAQQDPSPDPYRLSAKPHEPALCMHCGAVHEDGRWHWGQAPVGATALTCPACRRVQDRQPAGVVTLHGRFVVDRHTEILSLARHQEEAERAEHPMNRVIDIEQAPDRIVINTTDVHLAQRIGKAQKHAYGGQVESSFEEDGTFVRVDWHRDD